MKTNKTSTKKNNPVYQIIVDRNEVNEDAKLWLEVGKTLALWLIFLTLYLHWY